MLLVPYMHYVCSWYVWCHWALVAESRLPLKMVAGTFVQMGSVRAQVDQQFHMFICFYKWSIMSVWSRCMWVEYCLRMWRDKYSICVLERETKSCVAVYVEMPGVNKNPPTGTSEPDTIWRHASCSLQVERKSSVCEPPQPVTSLSLLSCPHYQPCLHSWGRIFISSLIFFITRCFNSEPCWESLSVPLFHGNVASIDWIKLTTCRQK